MADLGISLEPLAVILGPLIDVYGITMAIQAFEASLPPLPTGVTVSAPTSGQLYPA